MCGAVALMRERTRYKARKSTCVASSVLNITFSLPGNSNRFITGYDFVQGAPEIASQSHWKAVDVQTYFLHPAQWFYHYGEPPLPVERVNLPFFLSSNQGESPSTLRPSVCTV